MGVFYTNLDDKFSKVKRIVGDIGTSKEETYESGYYLLREINSETKEKKDFLVREVNTLKFLFKRYWLLAIALFVLDMLFILFSPLVATTFLLSLEAILYFSEPYKNIKRAKKTILIVKIISISLFLYSSYTLFGGGLAEITSSLQTTKITLFMLIILYARTTLQGMFRKYEEIYKLVNYTNNSGELIYNEETDAEEFYVWANKL